MTILVKIKKNKDVYAKAFFDLLSIGSISAFKIEGEHYDLLTPFQAAALQKLGVELEFYRSDRTLYSYIPIAPKGTKVTRIKEGLEACVDHPEYLEQFVAGLRKKLKGGNQNDQTPNI